MQNNGDVSIAGSTSIGLASANERLNVNNSFVNVTMTVKARPGDLYALNVEGTPANTVSIFWTVSSDGRLKQEVKPYEAGLHEVLQLHTIRYRYKDDPKRGLSSMQEHTGVVAQEVQKVFPDAIITDKDGYLSLQADPIFWASIHAIQELNHKVEERDAKISELEKRLIQLEKTVQALAGAK
jgi:hypothetical protein